MWKICCLTSYSVVARSTECERGAGGWHGVRERLWGGGCVVRSSGRVECVGQRPAEARASCCSGVGEQGWRVDDLLSYITLLGRGEVHRVRARRQWVAWSEREIVGVWVCGVRSSGRVECVGQRAAEGRAVSCCWGVGEQGWRVDDLLSY